MFYRSTLIVYDLEGSVLKIDGEIQSNAELMPHNYPVGVPYLEIPFGDAKLDQRKLIKIDTTKPPHQPVWETINRPPTPQEQIETLENELLIAKGVI